MQSSLCSCAQGYWWVLTGPPPRLQALVESVTLYPWNWGAWLDLSILCPTPAVRRCMLRVMFHPLHAACCVLRFIRLHGARCASPAACCDVSWRFAASRRLPFGWADALH